MKKAILFSSCGRRCQLLQNCKKSLGDDVRIVATDANATAPALYFADAAYIVPRIDDPSYVDTLLEICLKENVGAITTLIDPEISLLANNREKFEKIGVLPLVPDAETAQHTFDKYELSRFIERKGIRGIRTFLSLEQCERALKDGIVSFPLFVKPRTGSGSAGVGVLGDMDALTEAFSRQNEDVIVQEYIRGEEIDLDVYVDPLSHEVVSMFAKSKIETRPGGTSKSVSIVDDALFALAERIVKEFCFSGPTDFEFFKLADGEYALIEINPRFSGAYLHAFGCGVDFFDLIRTNIEGVANTRTIGDYREDVCMMLFDQALIINKSKLIADETGC